MLNSYDFSPVRKALATAQSILVVLPVRPNQDKVAAALGLFLSLQKMGKGVSIVCPDEMTVEFSSLVGVDKISQRMDGNNLIISFDYIEDSIEKVSYNIEGDKFNLIIQPKEGSLPLSANKIDYTYSGHQADLIFIIGGASLENLGEIYQKNKKLFQQDRIVNLDRQSNNTHFGKINLVDTEAPSCAQLVIGLLSNLRLPVDTDIASNLFYGLQQATRHFALPNAGPGTFEAAAFCLRAGARRSAITQPKTRKRRKVPLKPMTAKMSVSRPPGPFKDKASQLEKRPEELPQDASPDWFEPKIYRGNTRI